MNFDLSLRNKKNNEGKDFAIRTDEYIRYSVFDKDYRSTFEISAFSMIASISEIKYTDNKLVITGKFDIKLRNKESKNKDYIIADITDGYFEIIF